MVKSEIYKLFKYKAFWILLLLQIGLSTLITIIDTPKTLSAALVSLDLFASFFLVFIVNIIARNDFQEGTMKNIIACGVKRSTVFRSKLIVSFLAALLLLAADGVIRVVIAFVKGATMGDGMISLLISVLLQILMMLLYACIFFSFSYLLYKGPWGMLISLYFVLFSSGTLGVADFILKLPIKLSSYSVGHIEAVAKNLVFDLDTLLPVLVTTLLVCGLTILVYAVTAKREIR